MQSRRLATKENSNLIENRFLDRQDPHVSHDRTPVGRTTLSMVYLKGAEVKSKNSYPESEAATATVGNWRIWSQRSYISHPSSLLIALGR